MSSAMTAAPLAINNTNNSTSHSMTNRHTDLRDADRQVKRGIEMIQDAYDRRTAELSNEVDHYKQQAASQRQEIQQLESEISQLTRRLSESERALASETAERRSLQSSKNALMERFTMLRKWAVQLETFRKSIVNMVEYSPTTPINMADLEQSFSEAALARGIGRMDPFQIANYALPEEFLRGSTFDGEDEAAAALMAESESARRTRDTTDSKGKRPLDHTRQNLYETPAGSSRRRNSDDTDNILWRTARSNNTPATASSSRAQPASSSKNQGGQAFLTRLKESANQPLSRQSPPPTTNIATYPTPSTGGRTSASRSAYAGVNPTPSVSHETSPLPMNQHTQERRTPYSTSGKTVDLRGSVITNGSANRATKHLQQTTRNVISDEELLEDAGIVYRRIRDVLSPQDFDRFAQAVSAFNAQQATASETMREVERLVVDRNLLQGMRRLIESAVDRAEASDEFEDEETDQEPMRSTGNRRHIDTTNQVSKGKLEEGPYHTPSSGSSRDLN